jgi:hypothetical protein
MCQRFLTNFTATSILADRTIYHDMERRLSLNQDIAIANIGVISHCAVEHYLSSLVLQMGINPISSSILTSAVFFPDWAAQYSVVN